MFSTGSRGAGDHHFKTIVESIPETPVLLYNDPGRVDDTLSAQLVDELAHNVPNIVGMKAHQLYMDKCYGRGARNDAVGMQYLIPGWKFDNKKFCLVRKKGALS